MPQGVTILSTQELTKEDLLLHGEVESTLHQRDIEQSRGTTTTSDKGLHSNTGVRRHTTHPSATPRRRRGSKGNTFTTGN